MKTYAKITILAVNTLLCVLIILGTYFFMDGWSVLVKTVLYVAAGVGTVAGASAFAFNRQPILKCAFVLVVLVAVVLVSFIAVGEAGHLNEYETDDEKIAVFVKMIEDTGAWGMAVFFAVQVLQVVILPLPAAVCYIPGSLIWGPLKATLLASAGVIAGSVIAYFIGKFFGKKAVVWIAGKETTEKYSAYLSKRGKVLFLLMQVLPFFPDDILCMIVGMTEMNFLFFILSIALVRPIVIAVYCYLGSGDIIPFNEPWGIAVWVVIFAACIALAVLSFKYQDKFEDWLVNKFSRRKKSEAASEERAEAVCADAEAEEQSAEENAETNAYSGGNSEEELNE